MKYPLVSRLSKAKLVTIIGVFVVVSLGLSAVLGLLISLTARPHQDFGSAFRYAVANAWNPGDLLERPQQSVWFYAVALTDAIFGVLLPTLLLGAFVFKLFQRDPLVWRTIASVERLGNGRPVLRFRFYNATRSAIVRVEVAAYARIRLTGQPGTVRNYRLPVLLRDGSIAENEYWAFGRTAVPYLISVPLWDPADTEEVGADSHKSYEKLHRTNMIFVPPYGEPTAKARVTFLLLANGIVLDTGQPFVSIAEYSAADALSFGHYQEIGTDYAEAPRKWPGWENFDGDSSMYVFGYGSLTKPESVSATLGRPISRADMHVAELRGWRRQWNVGSDRESHPDRAVLHPDGTTFDGVVVVLGLAEAAEHEACNGTVIPVSADDLAKLDVRERNYRRVDVSQLVTFAGKPANSVVFVYVPLVESVERLSRALDGAGSREVAIRRDYLEQTREGFQRMGDEQLAQFDAEPVPFPVRDLTFRFSEVLRDVDDQTDRSVPRQPGNRSRPGGWRRSNTRPGR